MHRLICYQRAVPTNCVKDGDVPAYHHPYIHVATNARRALSGSIDAPRARTPIFEIPAVGPVYLSACHAPVRPVDQVPRNVRNMLVMALVSHHVRWSRWDVCNGRLLHMIITRVALLPQ